MATIKIEIEGIKPLLTHNPIGMQTPKNGKGSTIPEPEDEAEAGTYRMPDGTCGVPGSGFRAALLGAAGAWKGPRARSTMKSAIAHIEVLEEVAPLSLRDGTPIKSYIIDKRRVLLQGKNGVIRCRPRFEEWCATFTVEYDDLLLPKPEILIEIANDAGRRMGLGDFRPQKNGPFGRFAVRA